MKTYRVPVPPGALPSTENDAATEALYHPPPLGVPCADWTVRKNCSWNVASTVDGPLGVIVWERAPPSDHEANT